MCASTNVSDPDHFLWIRILLFTLIRSYYLIRIWIRIVNVSKGNVPKKVLFINPGVYILVRKLYLFPPFSENYIFSPLATCRFSTPIKAFFALIPPYFAFILPFYFPFFLFFFPVSSFLSRFFIFLSFFSSPFHIFPPTCHWLIAPPVGRGVFSNIYIWTPE
jgi:hypothetical protein